LRRPGKEAGVEDVAAPLVLVVDDDQAIRSILIETLTGEGYRVGEASNGAEGLDRLHDGLPDLILLDILMPVLNGYQFLEQLLRDRDRRHLEIPIVLLSATHALPAAAQSAGVKAVLTKPFDMGVLLAIVDRLTRTVR
jgi:CheY-like chemotaxis protein